MKQRRKNLIAILAMLGVVGGLWAIIGAQSIGPRLGLDLKGGISVVLSPKDENPDSSSIDKAVDIIRNRVDALGVAEPEIQRQGSDVLVQLPGIKEQDRALKLIGTTAKLRFRPVLAVVTANDPEYPKTGPADCSDPSGFPTDDPAKEIVLCLRDREAAGGEGLSDRSDKMRLGPIALEGADVSGASAQLPSGSQIGQGGGWFVSLDLTREGGDKFEKVTGELACNRNTPPRDQLAIVLDRVVESAPQMGEGVECNRGISGGNAQITGNFGESDARDLALVLRYGALPVELEPLTTTTISPRLGRDSLRGGLIAGAIGLGIVFLYVLLFYRALGFVVWLGLGLHALFTYAVIIILGETNGFALTLAGIAGLIVSVGIATDSFIVYFERIKDEVHQGRTVKTAVDRAWESARRTIIAADLVTALAAIVLYVLAVGSVRGFALMLGLATGLDVLISFFFMHPLVWLLSQTRALASSRSLGAARPAVAGGSE